MKNELKQLLASSQPKKIHIKKTISKPKTIPQRTPQTPIPKYNAELVEFVKKMYARIVVEICNKRVHDEDSGCDFEYVSLKSIEEYEFQGEPIKLVYLPVDGNEFGWCEEAVYYVNFPEKIKFSQATLNQCKIALEEVRQTLLFNFNELRHQSGGKWFEELQAPISARRIMHLVYDLYYRKENNGWKIKFHPGEKINSACGGRWCPYDVASLYDETATERKDEEYKEYADVYKYMGFNVPVAQ